MIAFVGLATLDTILPVPRHPEADDLVVATDRVVAGGGPAATAAVAAARLGAEAVFVGAVGDDPAGAEVRAGLEREGVDVSELVVVPGLATPQSVILVGDGTRAIVTTPPSRLELSDAAADLCRRAEWVHADHVGYPVAPAGVRLSVDGGHRIPDLDLDRIDLYVPTERTDDGRRAALTVVTRGADGCVAYRDGETIEVPAVPVEAVSTLGAGDVFHGALVVALAAGLPLRACLERASLCAALSCRGLDGRSAIPSAAELEGSLA